MRSLRLRRRPLARCSSWLHRGGQVARTVLSAALLSVGLLFAALLSVRPLATALLATGLWCATTRARARPLRPALRLPRREGRWLVPLVVTHGRFSRTFR